MMLRGRIHETVEKNRQAYVGFLMELIDTETTDEKEDQGQAVLRRRLERLPCRLDYFSPDPARLCRYEDFNVGHSYASRGNLVAVFSGERDENGLLLNGHMDTVFPNDPDAWKSDPLRCEIRDGKLYGLGACDMKAGLCAMTLAMEVLCGLGVRFQKNIILESVCDEEAGGGNGTLAAIDRGYTAPAALVGEPTSLRPMRAHVGSVAFRITFKGRAAHSNIKWEGVNAFEEALPFIHGFYEMERRWLQKQKNPLFHHPACSINVIRCGTGAVCIPDACVLEGNFTYLPGYDGCIEEFTAVLTDASQSPWLREHPPVLEWLHHVRPYESGGEHPFLKSLLRTLTELGGADAYEGFATGADARLLANIGGMNTVILGPGDIRNGHRANEYVIVDEFIRAVELYANIIADFLAIPE